MFGGVVYHLLWESGNLVGFWTKFVIFIMIQKKFLLSQDGLVQGAPILSSFLCAYANLLFLIYERFPGFR